MRLFMQLFGIVGLTVGEWSENENGVLQDQTGMGYNVNAQFGLFLSSGCVVEWIISNSYLCNRLT